MHDPAAAPERPLQMRIDTACADAPRASNVRL